MAGPVPIAPPTAGAVSPDAAPVDTPTVDINRLADLPDWRPGQPTNADLQKLQVALNRLSQQYGLSAKPLATNGKMNDETRAAMSAAFSLGLEVQGQKFDHLSLTPTQERAARAEADALANSGSPEIKARWFPPKLPAPPSRPSAGVATGPAGRASPADQALLDRASAELRSTLPERSEPETMPPGLSEDEQNQWALNQAQKELDRDIRKLPPTKK